MKSFKFGLGGVLVLFTGLVILALLFKFTYDIPGLSGRYMIYIIAMVAFVVLMVLCKPQSHVHNKSQEKGQRRRRKHH